MPNKTNLACLVKTAFSLVGEGMLDCPVSNHHNVMSARLKCNSFKRSWCIIKHWIEIHRRWWEYVDDAVMSVPQSRHWTWMSPVTFTALISFLLLNSDIPHWNLQHCQWCEKL